MAGVCPSWAQDYSGLPGRKLVCTYTLGDAMGEASGITKQEHFFAGADNRPLRGCLQGKGTGADFTLTKYYSFSQAAEDKGFQELLLSNGCFPMNLSGQEAVEYLKSYRSITSWLLYDSGAAQISPEEFGIEKP